MAVESDQAARRACGLFAALRELRARGVDQRARARFDRRSIEKRGLRIDLGTQRHQRVGHIEQRRACRSGSGQRQAVDRCEGLCNGGQVFGQPRRAADDLFDQQSATRQDRAHRQRALDARHMAARRGALVARGFVGEVGGSVETHLALLGQAGEQAAADQAHMVMRQAFVVQRGQRRIGPRRTGVAQRLAQAGEQGVVRGAAHGL